MGILNLTPDSFYDGGRNNSLKKAIEKAEQYISEGVDCIDIGAYSTRPGATPISIEEEHQRLLPVLKEISRIFPELIVSVDTFRSDIAKIAVNEGASIINDISGGTLDKNMFSTIAQLKVTYVLMHIIGSPQTMQLQTFKGNIVEEVQKYFTQKLKELSKLGVNDVILDVGFGFGKTLEQNYLLLRSLTEFHSFKKPILVGLSRKSMFYKLLNTTPDDALNATIAAQTLALTHGIDYIRTHDVKATRQTIQIYQAYVSQ